MASSRVFFVVVWASWLRLAGFAELFLLLFELRGFAELLLVAFAAFLASLSYFSENSECP